VKGSVIPLPNKSWSRKTNGVCFTERTNNNRREIDRCQAVFNERGVLVINRRGKKWDIPSLKTAPSVTVKIGIMDRYIHRMIRRPYGMHAL
jgi:hypothetical protein